MFGNGSRQDTVSAKGVSSDCSCLKVEHDSKTFFVSDTQGIVRLCMTPLSGELRNILIFMGVSQGETKVKKQIQHQEILTVGRSFEVNIPYQPKSFSGALMFDFRIGCKMLDGIKYYQFTLEYTVYDPNRTNAALPGISINTNVENKHAGTMGNVSIHGIDGIRTSDELLKQQTESEHVFTEVSLRNIVWSPEKSFFQGIAYATDKLMLECNGFRIYLLNRPSVKLGRKQELNDIVVRTPGAGPHDYPNNTVSRIHTEIVYCEDTVKLFDRSTHGTYINGRKPDDAGIPMQDHATIEFGDIHWEMAMQHCTGRSPHFLCETCPAHGIRSVVFTRKDNIPEAYLLIWQCCELGLVDERLAGWTLFARDRAFFLRNPAGEISALNPGTDLRYQDSKIHITYFQQN